MRFRTVERLFLLGTLIFAWLASGCDADASRPGQTENQKKASSRFFGRLIPAGTPAPDFILPCATDDSRIHLADLLEHRPVVLILGSFGCDYFCFRLDQVKELHQRFGDRAEFLFVYIDNNHPEPDLPLDPLDAFEAHPPHTRERLARIRAGLKFYDLRFPCVVDTADNQVQKDYEAFPARLLIVDRGGKIAVDTGTVIQSGLNLAEAESWLELQPQAGQQD